MHFSFAFLRNEIERAFKASFSLLTNMLEKAQNAFPPNLSFLCLVVFKMLNLTILLLQCCHFASQCFL